MKTILSLLLLPIMVLAQPHGQHQIESFDIEFSMDFAMEPILNEETDSPEPVDGTIELFITIEVYVWEMEIDYAIPQFTHDAAIVSYLPQISEYFFFGRAYQHRKGKSKTTRTLESSTCLERSYVSERRHLVGWVEPR